MKKNIELKLGALVLALTLISVYMVSGTFAKYTKEVAGADTARAAKFAFNLTDGDNTYNEDTASGTQVLDIFSYTDNGVYNNGVDSEGNKLIAPGTTGSLPITVENLSEVDVAITFDIDETNTNSIPIYYTIDGGSQRYSAVLTGSYAGGTYKALSDLAADLAATEPTLQATDGVTPTSASYELNWAWAYESAGTGQTDASDTALGIADTAPTVSLTITTTVTQVD